MTIGKYYSTKPDSKMATTTLNGLKNLWPLQSRKVSEYRPTRDPTQTIENAVDVFPDLPDLAGAYSDLASVLEEIGDSSGATAARKRSAKLRKELEEVDESRRKAIAETK